MLGVYRLYVVYMLYVVSAPFELLLNFPLAFSKLKLHAARLPTPGF